MSWLVHSFSFEICSKLFSQALWRKHGFFLCKSSQKKSFIKSQPFNICFPKIRRTQQTEKAHARKRHLCPQAWSHIQILQHSARNKEYRFAIYRTTYRVTPPWTQRPHENWNMSYAHVRIQDRSWAIKQCHMFGCKSQQEGTVIFPASDLSQ